MTDARVVCFPSNQTKYQQHPRTIGALSPWAELKTVPHGLTYLFVRCVHSACIVHGKCRKLGLKLGDKRPRYVYHSHRNTCLEVLLFYIHGSKPAISWMATGPMYGYILGFRRGVWDRESGWGDHAGDLPTIQPRHKPRFNHVCGSFVRAHYNTAFRTRGLALALWEYRNCNCQSLSPVSRPPNHHPHCGGGVLWRMSIEGHHTRPASNLRRKT
ncbi:hypothetical protein EDC04DRAFT_2725029 [Pisolithus marmoratus]|nr:hypothetical protein EDC04DRAFT_2725029 [Pisolithus marmoratus]